MRNADKMDQIGCPERQNFGFLQERAADPADPPDGEAVLWFSDGTDSGDDGDVMVTKTVAESTTSTALGTAAASAANTAELLVLDGANLANVATDQVIGGIPIVFPLAIPAGAAGSTDVIITQKIKVIRVDCQHTAGAGEASDTVQLLSTAAAITNAIDWSGADNVIVSAGTLDDANATVASGGKLRVTTVDNDAGDDVGAGVMYVYAIPVA